MGLSIEKRIGITQIFTINNLQFKRIKFEKLRSLAQKENINVSKLTFRKLNIKWSTTGKYYNFKFFVNL